MWRRLLSVRCPLHSLQKVETMQRMWEGTARKTEGAKALLFKELNASLAISSQTCLCHRLSVTYKDFYLNPTLHTSPLIARLSFLCVPVLLLRSYSEKSFAPSFPWVLNLWFSPLKHYMPWKDPWANLTLSIQKSVVTFYPTSVPQSPFTNSKLLLHLMGLWCPGTLTSTTSMKDTIDRKITGLCLWRAWNSAR